VTLRLLHIAVLWVVCSILLSLAQIFALLSIAYVSFFTHPLKIIGLHWTAVKRILWYIQHTRSHGLSIRPFSLGMLSAYSDADWVGDVEDRRSTGGHALFYGGNLIAWSARK
jgi:hypothetical protein